MEIGFHQFLDFLWFVLYVRAERAVVERAQLSYNAVNHGRAEHARSLKRGALLFKAICRGGATVRQLRERGKSVAVGTVVDVYIDVGLFRHFECISHLETVTASDTKTCQQLIEVGASVWRTHFHGLFCRCVRVGDRFVWIGGVAKVNAGGPSQRHANQDASVSVAPANVGRSLLMRNKTEIGGWVFVSESGDGRSQFHHAGNGAARGLAQLSVRDHLVASVLHDAHVDVQAATRLPDSDFWCEGDVQSVFVGKVSNDPLRQHHLVCRLFRGHRQKLDFVLLIDQTVLLEVAHFRMTVFDLSACLRYVEHTMLAEVVHLGVRCRFVVTSLVDCRIAFVIVGDDVVLQLAHGVELHSSFLTEGLARLAQGVFWRRGERLPVLVEVTAQQTQGWYFGKRVQERGGKAWQHV